MYIYKYIYIFFSLVLIMYIVVLKCVYSVLCIFSAFLLLIVLGPVLNEVILHSYHVLAHRTQ